MKPHQHALVSVVFCAGLTAAANHGITDPWLYVAAVAGGQAIDLVDHPLYHLMSRRGDTATRSALSQVRRRRFREAWHLLSQAEDGRLFVGLWAHNVGGLVVLSVGGFLLALLVNGPPWIFIFAGSVLLHMLSDLVGDLWTVGHVDNWWWFMSIERFKALPAALRRGARVLLLPVYVGIAAFLALALRAYESLNMRELSLRAWEYAVPALSLLAYVTMFTAATLLVMRKYLRCVGNARTTDRLHDATMLQALRRRHEWGVVVTAIVIAAMMVGLGTFTSPPIIFLACVVTVLAVSTFVHSTPGELGGVYGVVFGMIANVLLSDAHVVGRWPGTWTYLAASIAVAAVLIGIAGSILIRGRIQMSVSLFEFEYTAGQTRAAADVLSTVAADLARAYCDTHSFLGLGKGRPRVNVATDGVVFISTTDSNDVMTSGLRVSVTERIAPRNSEVAFLFLDRSRFSTALTSTHALRPVMPRTRVSCPTRGDVTREGDGLVWVGTVFRGSAKFEPADTTLMKVIGEVVDNLHTRYADITTEVVIQRVGDDGDAIRVTGVTAERTSTKAYSTIESQTFAASTLHRLLRRFSDPPRTQCRRVVSEKSAVYEWLVTDAWRARAMPFRQSETMERIKVPLRGLGAPVGTLHLGRQIAVFASEVSLTVLLAILGLQAGTSHLIEQLLR